MSEDKRGKIAIIGDPDILVVFKILGMEVYPARNEKEAREALSEVETKNFQLCFLQQDYYSLLSEKVKKKELWPVFMPFRDYRQAEDLLEGEIRKMMIKATGSDSLLKKGR